MECYIDSNPPCVTRHHKPANIEKASLPTSEEPAGKPVPWEPEALLRLDPDAAILEVLDELESGHPWGHSRARGP